MKKREIIDQIAYTIGESDKTVTNVIDTFIDMITDNLINNEPVDIQGFAKFESVTQAARMVKNPKTGELVQKAEKLIPKCRFKPTFKTKIAE